MIKEPMEARAPVPDTRHVLACSSTCLTWLVIHRNIPDVPVRGDLLGSRGHRARGPTLDDPSENDSGTSLTNSPAKSIPSAASVKKTADQPMRVFAEALFFDGQAERNREEIDRGQSARDRDG